MADPWVKVRDEWPVIFTATTVSILSSSVFHASTVSDVASFAFWKSFGSVAFSVLMSILVVYGVVWLVHGAHRKVRR